LNVDFLTPEMMSAASALVQVVFIDLVFAGDNAVAVGMAAAALPPEQRRKAILAGIAVALVCRIVFALITVQLMSIKGLLIVGGILLLWVAWRMARELMKNDAEAEDVAGHPGRGAPTTFFAAFTTIVVADVTMSLDNVLGVASVSQHHPEIMVFGLVLSVALMGAAANYIAQILHKHRWIGWLGLAVIVFAAVRMIYHDAENLGWLAQLGIGAAT
jgi:YjbE family integral membrane protein